MLDWQLIVCESKTLSITCTRCERWTMAYWVNTIDLISWFLRDILCNNIFAIITVPKGIFDSSLALSLSSFFFLTQFNDSGYYWIYLLYPCCIGTYKMRNCFLFVTETFDIKASEFHIIDYWLPIGWFSHKSNSILKAESLFYWMYGIVLVKLVIWLK